MNRPQIKAITGIRNFLASRMLFIATISILLAAMKPVAIDGQELKKQASWSLPETDQLNGWLEEWNEASTVDQSLIGNRLRPLKTELLKESSQSSDRLNTTVGISGLLFPRSASMGRTLQSAPKESVPWNQLVDSQIFSSGPIPESARTQLRLATGCWLARHSRFDDALELLAPLKADQVVSPDLLLFYRGLAQHRLLATEDCLETLNRLLENQDLISRRHRAVAKLMVSDLQTLKPDSLNEIARLMQDVKRRIGLHRSGQRVLDQESLVINKLDRMIDELEEQLQQQQQQAANSQETPQDSSQPMQDSQPSGGRGSGDVADKPVQDGGDWGSLPARQRVAALEEMAKGMPPHYREVIEEYFRQLAREPGQNRRKEQWP